MTQREAPIMKAIRQAVNLDGRCRLVRNNTGVGRALRSEQIIRYGLGNGGADLVGIVREKTSVAFGRVFCIEVKVPGEKQDPDQVAWGNACRANGGFYAVASSIPEALAAVERACAGGHE